jgi:hypothetical protein
MTRPPPQPSGTTSSARQRAQIGPPRVLPLRVAAQVAWRSIRVRLVRSLVSVSSVVLAVAFLLAVLGQGVTEANVYRRWRAQSLPGEQLAQLREVLARPRSVAELLRLVARAPAPAQPVADAIPPGTAQTAVRLIAWAAALKPTHAYLLTRNRDLADWALHVDSPAAVDALIASAAGFTGRRLPLAREELITLSRHAPALAAAVDALRLAEPARLARVAAAGGVEAVLDLVQRGAAPGDLREAGLPLDEALPGLDAAQTHALREQIRIERLRTRAAAVLAEANRIDPSLLRTQDVTDWAALARAWPGNRLLARLELLFGVDGVHSPDPARLIHDAQAQGELITALDRELARPELYDEEAWRQETLPAEALGLLKQNLARMAERRLTRLNRLLLEHALAPALTGGPALETFDLRQLVGDHPDATGARTRALVTAALGADGAAELRAELLQRAQLEELARTFAGDRGTPGGGRTVWLVVLSLLVCVVGIVNTMMMAVTERFREIATMKCLGALDSFIVKSFLIESAAMGVAGSLVGVALGLALVVVQAATRFGAVFWATLPVADLLAACVAGMVAGLVLAVLGALLPALVAARMHPIEAMRVDA